MTLYIDLWMIEDYIEQYKQKKKTLLSLLLDKVIPKYINTYRNRDFYPVILGGFDVMRCLAIKKETRTYIDLLFSSDIDINFVIVKSSKDYSSSEQFEKEIELVMEAREQFLNDILSDADVTKHLKKMSHPLGTIDIVVNRKLMQNPLFRPFKLKIVRLDIVFKAPGVPDYTDELIDTGIYHSENVSEFRFYDAFGKTMVQPIPVYIHRGVPYATCKYVFYDTIRMLSYYYSQISQKGVKPKYVKYNFIKFIKYMLKFCALYIVVEKKKNTSEYKEFFDIFEKARLMLIISNKYDNLDHIPIRMKKTVQMIFNQLKYGTNLDQMQEVIQSHILDTSRVK